MKITGVETLGLGVPLRQPLGWGAMSVNSKGGVIVRITTDAGIVGLGEAGLTVEFFDTVSPIVNRLKPLLIGQDPQQVGSLWERMHSATHQWGRRGLETYAMSGVDIALWDILGRVAGAPVYRLLGGHKSEVKVYFATSLKSPDEIVAECGRYVAEGITAIKLRAGLGPDLDEELVSRVRREVGDDIDLMVDANMSYNRWTALRMARIFEEHGVCWLEEPIRTHSLEHYASEHRWLAARADIPLAGGESLFTRFEYTSMLAPRVFDILQPDCTCVGGITEAKRVADLAGAFNVECIPHVACSSGTGIGLAAGLQVVLASTNAPMLEFDAYGGPGWDGLLAEPMRVKDGRVHASDAPGLGVELAPGAEERFRLR